MPTGSSVNLPIFFKDTLLIFHNTVKLNPIEDLEIPRLRGNVLSGRLSISVLPAPCSEIHEEKAYFQSC